jgi:hypothetical protein
MLDISSPLRQADEPPDATSDVTQSRPPNSMLNISSVQQGDEPDMLPSDDIAKESSLVDSHPCRDQWPLWMSHAVSCFEDYNDSAKWRQLLLLWLEFEDKFRYPYGQVS